MDEVIPLAVPDLRGNEAAYLARCVTTNWVSSTGPDVSALERRMAELTGRAHGLATVNGTAALHLTLVAAGVGPGDLVVVPDWTFAATANAVFHAGAMPLFVDIARDSWTLDPTLAAKALDGIGRGRVKAVIAVHALGHPADMDALRSICAERDVPLIEDAAGAIGARHKGRPAGALGDAAIFSFNGNKTVTAGGGGMIVTDNDAWAGRARLLSTQARESAGYRYVAAGYNYRMPNVNAALGLAQLERLDEMVAAKRRIAAAYDRALVGRADLVAMPRCAWAESACWLYSVLSATRTAAASLVTAMTAARIEARCFWEGLADQGPYAKAPRLLNGAAAALSGRVVSLPCSSALTDQDQGRVIEALGAWHGAALEDVA